MKMLENGQLYFICPYVIPALNAKTKDVSTDITYLTYSDSITMNMTIWNDTELQTDSIVLIGRSRISISDFQTFYIEKDKKLWAHRYSLHYRFTELAELYRAPFPFVLCIYAQGTEIRYSYSPKAWEKESVWMNQILHIISTNKRLYE